MKKDINTLETKVSEIEGLPFLHRDVVEMKNGLGGYDAMSVQEIAETLEYDYVDHFNYMSNEYFELDPAIVVEMENEAQEMLEAPDFPMDTMKFNVNDLKNKEKVGCLSWHTIRCAPETAKTEEGLRAYMEKRFGDVDYVVVPSLTDLFFYLLKKDYLTDGFAPVDHSEYLEMKYMARRMVAKLDEMGKCVVCNTNDRITGRTWFDYVYLGSELAEMVTLLNPCMIA